MAPVHPPFDGERFRAERKAAGYTAGEFAVLVGRTRQTLRNYEVGRSRPSPATVERIGQVLGIDGRTFRKGTIRPDRLTCGPEVTAMPRSLQDILDHADELAERAERGDFDIAEPHGPEAQAAARLLRAVLASAEAEREIRDAVGAGREAGLSWRRIGEVLGLAGETVRGRFAGVD
jgi:transcriptional regulator with XRE-family HTH domain